MSSEPIVVSPLTRRDFVRTGAAGFAGLAVLGPSLHAASGATRRALRHVTRAGSGGMASRDVPLMNGWRFGGRATDGCTRPDFDDSGFEQITLPHCVADLSWGDWDPEDWEDVFIYRRRFDRPQERPEMRVFLDFEGVLTGTRPTLNGRDLPEHLGGYLPFSYEITDHLVAGENVLAVVVDGRFLDVPPNGNPRGAGSVDYFQPAGIYREVNLRVVPPVFLQDVFAKPVDVLGENRRVEVQCTIDGSMALAGRGQITVELRDGDRVVSRGSTPVKLDEAGQATVEMTLSDLGEIELWDLDSPKLYDVVATLVVDDEPVHDYDTRIGFREARFEEDGFFLNGRRVKLFGLNRHQTFPYTGMAMPARAQRKDAELLKKELNNNAVRCSHYPQSEHFLDACDEMGLLVFEEIPGWQYLSEDEAWQELAIRDVEVMIRRGRNRPSIVTWGVRINESRNDVPLYTRTRDLAERLDDSRPTHGAMVGGRYSKEGYVQDVFTYNDYQHNEQGAFLRPPLPGIPFVVTEAVGSLSGPRFYMRIDPSHVQQRQAELHGSVHHQAGSDDRYLGLVAWSALDYQSMTGWVNRRMKRNGVLDTFRVPKPGAAVYQSQIDPRIRPVIQPAFYWDFGPGSPPNGPGRWAMVCSNCDRLEVSVDGEQRRGVEKDLRNYGYLQYPPFLVDLTVSDADKPELKIEGYVGDELVLSRTFSSDRATDGLLVEADDKEIVSDGSDATRVVFRSVDKHGNPRPYVRGAVKFSLEGPGVLVGDNPFDFEANGGVGAVWVRSVENQPGQVRLTVAHPDLGERTVQVETTRPV